MWYVIQTISGKEHEVCMWINTHVDKNIFRRCFVPLFEDVWRKEGIGHISIKKMFAGYLFVETDTPEMIYEELKKLPQLSVLLSDKETESRFFAPLYKEEEELFDTILSDGLMTVSYIHINRNGKINRIIGPLHSYHEHIVKMDIGHRRAIVNIPILGETKRLKFGLWLDIDPPIDWIEEEKQNGTGMIDRDDPSTADPWDWKAWHKRNQEKKKKTAAEVIYGFRVGDYVIDTTGIYGDTPLKIEEIRPGKQTVVVNVLIFGNLTQVEIGVEWVEKTDLVCKT